MLFHTPLYLLYLAVVVSIYWVLPHRSNQKVFLLSASYIFYALIDWRFLSILLIITSVTYYLGLKISINHHAKFYAILSVMINLGALGVFKYLNFFLDSILSSMIALGVSSTMSGLNLLLPVGISFYTFQAISYTTEVYRRKIKPANNFVDFALYLSFFPKLLAGPLVRPKKFLEQIANPAKRIDRVVIISALGLLLLGLAKKVIIADGLASQADVAFRAAAIPIQNGAFPTPLYIQGFYLYAFQLYADFSGYTDIALASAILFGISLPENFEQPYLSSTITIFWNRWHMSLTHWFREYLYFPLSRNLLIRTKRKYSLSVQIFTTVFTMVFIGFWHGAAWTYIIWGGWHGILLSIERVVGIRPVGRLYKVVMGILTFHLVCIGWTFFGSESIDAAKRYLTGLFGFEQMYWLPYYLPSIFLTAGIVFTIDLLSGGYIRIPSKIGQNLKPILIISSIMLLLSLTLLGLARGEQSPPFIYGQF